MMNDMQGGSMPGKTCGCVCHKVVPIMVTLIGLDFLFANLGWVSESFLATSWPILVVIAGVSQLCKGMCKCCMGK